MLRATLYHRFLFLLVLGACFPLHCNADKLSMKIKKTVYTVLESVQSWDEARFIVCDVAPVESDTFRKLIVNPETNVPEVQASYAPSDRSHIMYLDSALVASIRKNNFVLPQEDRYKILYKVGLIKAYREKYPSMFRVWQQRAAACGLYSLVAFAYIPLLKGTPVYSDTLGNNLMKSGLCLGALSVASYVIDHKTKPVIDEQQDLLDTIQKAHLFAQNILEKK